MSKKDKDICTKYDLEVKKIRGVEYVLKEQVEHLLRALERIAGEEITDALIGEERVH